MFGFGVTNMVVVVVYLLGITALGSMAARWIKRSDEFIMPRRFGKSMLIMHAFGTGTHSDQAVSVAAKSYTAGLSGIWYQWLWLFVTPFYWFIAPMMRRFRAITIGDIFELRYGPSVSMLYSTMGMAMMLTNIGLMLRGAGAVVGAATPDALNTDLAIAAITVLFVIYGMAGGLSGAIITDFVQGIFTVLFSFILLPFVLNAVGGLGGMQEKIVEISGEGALSLVAPGEIGIFYVVVIAVNALVGIVTQPHVLGNCAAGREENDGQVGFMFGNLLKRVCTVAWTVTGLAAIAYFAGREINPDLIYGEMAREFFPRILPGLLGVFVASILAAVMSSCDSFMIASSGLFTNNLYKRFVTDKGEHHYLWVARVTGVVMVALGVGYAYWLPSVVRGLEIFWKVCAMMGVAFWLGVFWRRATAAGAWAATVTSLAAWALSAHSEAFVHAVSELPLADTLQFVVSGESGLEMYMPWQMLFYLFVGLLTGVVVSLLTPRRDGEKLERYYALLRTPVRGEEEVPEPCTLPDDVTVPEKDELLPESDLRIPKPSVRGVVGFLVGWACVLAIIIPVYLLIAA